MPEIDEVTVRVYYAYSEDYIPYRCRRTRTRWYSDHTVSTIRSISRSQVEPAFRITCHRFRNRRTREPVTVEVFRFEGQLWWEIRFGPQMILNKEHFFKQVERGYFLDQLAIGL